LVFSSKSVDGNVIKKINPTVMLENVETRELENRPNKNVWTKNIVKDPDAPELYSPRAIWGFSIFFTVIFGAVLLFVNLKNKKAKWVVIGFGLLYTSLVIIIMNFIPQPNAGLSVGLNGGGGLLLTNLFWDKYVGRETKFRAKPIWKPLIISILITIPFALAFIYS
jgi:hypothetical protein